ncbi:MAG: potassium channel family protein [Pseudomonadota bacterium]
MLTQLLVGTGLSVATIIVAALSWWGLSALLVRLHPWSARPPHGLKLMLILTGSLLWVLGMVTVAVWIWAFALYDLAIFETFEEAVYFSLVAFTTLGFGDILLPQEWRLLAGISAANGLLMIGLLTAILAETLRETRMRQHSYDKTKKASEHHARRIR